MHMKNDSHRAPVSQQPHTVEKSDGEGIGGQVSIEINGVTFHVPMGTTVLEACRMHNVHIPTLCYHEDLCLAGVCRVCVVEVEGMRTLQAACTYPVTNPMKIRTTSEKVRKARRHILALLLSEHFGECYSCHRNNNCELQALAKEYGVDSYRFGHVDKRHHQIDNSSYSVIRDMNKCILCKRCVRTCIDLQEVGVLEATNKGDATTISTFMDKPLADVICINCGQCINRCPTAALRANDPSDEIWAAIDDPKKHVVIQTAPSPRAAIGEEFGLEAGHSMTGELNTALRMIGYDRVFDTNFTADLTIMEEGTELLLRLKKALVDGDTSVKLPQFTSCSPGWVKFVEEFYPDFIPNISTCKSPQQMMGAIIKSFFAEREKIDPRNIFSVSIMPCTAKKFEAARPEMKQDSLPDIDAVLTTRELGRLLQLYGIDLENMPNEQADSPFGQRSTAGKLFGATGGVAEAAVRSAYFLLTGKELPIQELKPLRGFDPIKEAHLDINGMEVGIIVTSGLGNARKVLDQIRDGRKDIHFIEVMTCPGGCVAGGGQPIASQDDVSKRMQTLYKIDRTEQLRVSHQNEEVQRLYREYLGEPNSHKAHELLHTHYAPRKVVI